MKNVLYINTTIGKGGAAKVAYDFLYKNIEKFGFNTNFLTSGNHSMDEDENISEYLKLTLSQKLVVKKFEKDTGLLDFFNIKSYKIQNIKEFKQADIIHLHNMHGRYFSPLAFLFFFNKSVIWTLHDEQSFTGHCAWTYNCEKWQIKCKNCHNLKDYPQISKDTTAFLFEIKKFIYKIIKPTIICPSNWLKQRAEKSILGQFDVRHINNGVDENIFKLYDKTHARKELNLPLDKTILFFASDGSLKNPAKGGEYIQKTYEYFKDNKDILFVCTGGKERNYRNDNFLEFEYIKDENLMAKFYSASDLFIYPSLADNSPLVVLESLACQTPVIAFKTGGIPEQVKHMQSGYIANYKDEEDFIKGIETFLSSENLISNAKLIARQTIEENFTLDKMISEHIKLYKEISAK
jgi:glycosyltransferase involved in cell wall biosynthesis